MDTWKIRNKEDGYSMSFSDDMVEKCLGQYSRLKKKMLETDRYCDKWVIQTNMILTHPIGSLSFILNLYYDGNVVIYSSLVQRMQGHNISDIIFLKKAIIWAGWRKLTCTPSEIDSSIDFWKRWWETGLIDSEYLDNKFKRKD